MKEIKKTRKFKIIGWLVIIIVVIAIVAAGVCWMYKSKVKKVSTFPKTQSIAPRELTQEEKQYLDQNIEKIKAYFEQRKNTK